MIPKLPEAHNNHLIIIQLLDDNEPWTGQYLASIIKNDSPYIGQVHDFKFFDADNLRKFLSTELPDYCAEKSNVVIYLDSHGTEHCEGIASKHNVFLNWNDLINALKTVSAKLLKKPTLILTACNGIGIKNLMDKLEEPILSKLIAGNGIMYDGPVLSAFRQTFVTKGTDIGTDDVRNINNILKERRGDHPNFEYIEY